MRVAFAGTPFFAEIILEGLLGSRHEVGLVISQPDAARGRGRKTKPPPVAELALREGLSVVQPDRIGGVADEIVSFDALVVAAYGQILRADTLYAAKHDAWNVHASLLPAYRGAAPIERALMNGETKTGISIMRMNEGLDTGPVALRRDQEISEDMDAGELTTALAQIGARAIVEVLNFIENGAVELMEQDESKASYAEKIGPKDREIDWGRSAKEIHDQVRALSPAIGAQASHPDFKGPIKILRTRVAAEHGAATQENHEPGTILRAEERILVSCGEGVLQVDRLQAPGKTPLAAGDFLRGRGLAGSFGG